MAEPGKRTTGHGTIEPRRLEETFRFLKPTTADHQTLQARPRCGKGFGIRAWQGNHPHKSKENNLPRPLGSPEAVEPGLQRGTTQGPRELVVRESGTRGCQKTLPSAQERPREHGRTGKAPRGSVSWLE